MHTKWNPVQYSQASHTQNNHAYKLIKEISFVDIESILDIGSGNGHTTHHMAEQNKHASVLGIDHSAEMTQYAQETYQAHNLNFQQLEAENMGFNNQFDLAVSFSTLHWIKDQQSVFEQAYQALKPGGLFIGFLYPKCDIQCHSLKQIIQDPKYQQYFPHFFEPFHGYTDIHYQRLATHSNFHICRIELTPTEYIEYENKAALANFLGGWLPHAKCLPENLKSSFLNDFVTTYCNNINQEIDQHNTDKIIVPFRKIEFELLKAT